MQMVRFESPKSGNARGTEWKKTLDIRHGGGRGSKVQHWRFAGNALTDTAIIRLDTHLVCDDGDECAAHRCFVVLRGHGYRVCVVRCRRRNCRGRVQSSEGYLEILDRLVAAGEFGPAPCRQSPDVFHGSNYSSVLRLPKNS